MRVIDPFENAGAATSTCRLESECHHCGDGKFAEHHVGVGLYGERDEMWKQNLFEDYVLDNQLCRVSVKAYQSKRPLTNHNVIGLFDLARHQ